MPVALPQEVFLSHASQDSQFASAVAETLSRHGIRVWFSQTNILGAQQWQVEIGTALQRCDWFAVYSFTRVSRVNVGKKGIALRVATKPF